MAFDWEAERERAARKAIDAFGDSAEYAPVSAPSYPLAGVFTNAHTEVQPGQSGYSTTRPAFDVRLADMEDEPRQRDRLTVGGVEYEVWDHQPNGQGGIRLLLRKS